LESEVKLAVQKMKVVERIQLRGTPELRQLCHLSKNLYNQALYLIKKTLETEIVNGRRKWMRYYELYKNLKDSENYKALPAPSAQWVLKLLDKSWKSYFITHKDWKVHPEKYFEEPQPPKYKPKDGENLLTFTNQQCRIKYNTTTNKFELVFPKKVLPPVVVNPERVPLGINQVRLLPLSKFKSYSYTVEIVYEREVEDAQLDPTRMIAIDLGLRNTVTVVNNIGLRPFIVRGGLIKSINQFYNKRKAELQQVNATYDINRETKRLQQLRRTRNNKINDLFHKLSRAIIEYCVQYGIGTIVIGYNEGWKQNCNMGKRNNQNFVNIPFHQLVNQLQYKADLLSIAVVQVNEDHTSKCSFLDKESIEHHEAYVGQRGVYVNGTVCRGLFKTQTGKIINADVNGAYNILRKAFPEAVNTDGIEGLGLVPYAVKFAELEQLANLKSTHKVLPEVTNADGIEVSRETDANGSLYKSL